MVRTRVGYAGGTTKDPTYYNLVDHAETIQIDYDPTQISYEELLDVFWDSHNPTERSWSRQYMSIVFYHNEEQKSLAIRTRDREAVEAQGEIFTEIIPASEFYLAEAYHQKYRLQQELELVQVFRATYPNNDEFVDSTAAARINGYLGGYSTFEALQVELDKLSLPPEVSKNLLDIVYALKH